jgi:hypothetical protein
VKRSTEHEIGILNQYTASDGLNQRACFSQRFCELTNSSLNKYEQTLFKLSLHTHARPIAFFLLRIRPEIFAEDFSVIRELAAVECPEIFAMEVERFDGRNKRDRTFLRSWLGIRISGQRLTRWKVKCFREPPKVVVPAKRVRTRRRKQREN